MGDSINPGIFSGRTDGKGKAAAPVIVIMTVPGMNGHVQKIIPFYQMNLFQFYRDSTAFLQGGKHHFIQVGVGPIAAGPFPIKNGYTENGIRGGPMNLKIHFDQQVLSILKDVSFLTLAIQQPDFIDFDVPVALTIFGNNPFQSVAGRGRFFCFISGIIPSGHLLPVGVYHLTGITQGLDAS